MNERHAIWSVPAGWRIVFFWLFTLQLTVCSSLVIWYHIDLRDSLKSPFPLRGKVRMGVAVAGSTDAKNK